ncbi:MAG: terpene cyclase/mutase family protein [Planctomycetes bacterium]|nr:terpene cyclase/mutase family protein [Planctomycetota bacterium]
MACVCPQFGRWPAALVGVLLLTSGLTGSEPPDLPKPGPAKVDEPRAKKFSLAKGAEFLDRAAIQWFKAQDCSSCHTSYPFLMARPMLGDPKAPALVWMRAYLEGRVAGWDKGKKGAGLPAEEDEAVTEIVATAATLAFDDARGGKLNPRTRQALDRMWTVQRKDGSWDWNKHNLPPQELDEYFGVVYAALGVGYAPEGYAKSEAAKDGVARLKAYLRENRAPNLHHRTWLLWASLKLDGLMTAEERDQTVQSLLKLQRKDGGWNLPSLGDWKRLDGTANDANAPSDGYATGLVVYVLRQTGMSAEKESLKRGVAWLKANQRESGRWYTRSLNADRAHYTTNAGTAFALMALKACGVTDE